jgi:hypothetical protein
MDRQLTPPLGRRYGERKEGPSQGQSYTNYLTRFGH